MYINSEIDEYWVHFQSGGSKKDNIVHPKALIKCYFENEFVLQASFFPDNKSIPENYYDVNSKLVHLRYPVSMYASILDIMRNEKPIFFSFSERSQRGYIRTGKEPIGEGENDADF